MVYKVIDDETALLIYEAVQESSDRSFEQYNRMRQLPRTKINGEIIFYLDALMDFATKTLGREPSETLQEVVDAGVVSFFSNLDPSLQAKVGFSLGDDSKKSAEKKKPQKPDAHIAETKAQLEDARKTIKALGETVEGLTRKAESLESELEEAKREYAGLVKENQTLKSEKETLRREKASLSKSIDELMDQRAADGQPTRGPAFLNSDSMGSMYTEMTTHMLTPGGNGEKASTPKKKAFKKKKRGS